MPSSPSSSSRMIHQHPMPSPTGVSDFIEVNRDTLHKNFGESRHRSKTPPPSWVDDSTRTSNSEWELVGDEEDHDIAAAAAAANAARVREEMATIQRRLEWLDEQQPRDRQDYYDQLRQAKKSVREELFDKYEPILRSQGDDSVKYEDQVRETTKIIGYLRGDNARMREELSRLKKKTDKLKSQNAEAEASLATIHQFTEQLHERIAEMEAVQKKLNDNCTIFKGALQQMKADYQKRTSFCELEVAAGNKYEVCLAKVLVAVQRSAGKINQKTAEKLERDIFQITEEGAKEIAKGRQTQLDKLGLKMNAHQQAQIRRLINPDLLIVEHKRLSGDYDDDDLSASDTDSDSEPELEE